MPPELNLEPDDWVHLTGQAEEILAIARATFAYGGQQDRLRLNEGQWTFEGKHYDITYNPENENFYVVGKNGSPMTVQQVGQQLDFAATGDISAEDVERFRQTAAFLEQQEFDRDLSPAETIFLYDSIPSLEQTDSIDLVQRLDAQAQASSPPQVILPPAPLTLETAGQLSAEEWVSLVPRQQVKLAHEARQHQRTEPQGYTKAEQWVGQRAQYAHYQQF